MTDDGICPVCESKITPGIQVCDVCGADLKLLVDSPSQQYACPRCGHDLSESDAICPGCGARFADDQEVVFQCPACNTEVPSTASKCPRCGVEFLSEEEASVISEVPRSIESVPGIDTPAVSSFSDISSGVSTGAPETLISEVEQKLKGMDQASSGGVPTGRDQVRASLREELAASGWNASTGQESRMERSEKHGLFHHRSGRRKDDMSGSGIRAAVISEAPSSMPGGGYSASVAGTQSGAVRSAQEPGGDMATVVEQLRFLLKLAGDAKVDISDGKKYLDASVEFAKSGNSAESIRQIRLAHKSIEGNIQSYFREKIEIMRKQIEIENVAGEKARSFETRLSSISELVRNGSYTKALTLTAQFQSEFSPRASQFGEAKELVDSIDELLRYADEIGIDYSNARMIFTEARKHLAVGDWSSALVLAKQSRDSLMRAIPTKLLSEMNRAKSQIIDAKIAGIDVNTFIATLKEASNAFNDGRYDESLRFMNIFRREFDRVRSLSGASRA